MTERPRVLFVGAFAEDPNAVVRGGQVAACKRLLASPLSERVEWQLLDTTMRSLPPPPMLVRGKDAALRVVRLARQVAGRPEAALVFTSFSASSLAEKGLMCALSRLRGVRTVLCIRSEVVPLRTPFAGLLRRLLGRVDQFVCQSERAKASLCSLYGIDPARVEVIGNWLDPSPYQGLGQKRGQGPVRLLYVGWLESWKGPGDLVEAMQQVSKDAELTMCGEGSMADALRQRALELGLRVRFTGWLRSEELIAEYDRADVLVMPSHTEGMPNAVLEAMASGLPIVATTAGGLPELVTDGENGLLVPPRDPRALAAAIEQLIAQPALREEMAESNRARIRARHDVANAWQRLYPLLRPPVSFVTKS